MEASDAITIITQDGVRGWIAAGPAPRGPAQWAEVILENGERLRVPGHVLVRTSERGYRLSMTLSEAKARWASPAAKASGERVFPALEENLKIDKRRVETGRIRVDKHVSERIENIDAALIQESCRIERVPVNRYVQEPPPVRQEGETTIIPVIEERLVVEKRLVVTEEIRISKERVEVHHPQEVHLRREQVDVERLPPRD